MRHLLSALFVVASVQACAAAECWETLPPTPAPLTGETTGYADVSGIKLFYASIGDGPPVVLLHGGLSNSDYWVIRFRPSHPATG